MRPNQEFFNLLGVNTNRPIVSGWVLLDYNKYAVLLSEDNTYYMLSDTSGNPLDKIITANNELMVDTKFISTDGVNWNTISGSGAGIISIAYSPTLNRYVGIRNGAPLLCYSNDGLNWTNVSSILSTPKDVIWGNGKFVSIGFITTTTQYVAMTSLDGITWTAATSQNRIGNWSKITYSPSLNLYVAVYPKAATGIYSTIMTSPDGLVWSFRTAPSQGGLTDVKWCADINKFVASANWSSGAGRPAYSTDGMSWSNSSIQNIDSFGVAFSTSLKVVLLLGNNEIWRSTNGIDFTQKSITGGVNNFLQFKSGIFVKGLGTGKIIEA